MERHAQKLKVYVFEPDVPRHQGLREAFTTVGYEVRIAGGILTALKGIVAWALDTEDPGPDVVLAEYFSTSPDEHTSGSWLQHELDRLSFTRKIPVVFTCDPGSRTTTYMAMRFRELHGAIGFIPKSTAPRDVVAMVSGLMWVAREESPATS